MPGRRVFLREVQAHIKEGLAEQGVVDEQDIQYYLGQMGQPREIVREALGGRINVVRLTRAAPILIIGVGLAVALHSTSTGTGRGGRVTVPRLLGLKENNAEHVLARDGLRSTLEPVRGTVSAPHASIVVRQLPSPGSQLRRGSVVTIVLGSST